MSQTAVLTPLAPDGFYRKKWTVKECRFLTDNGLLTPGKFELIEGEVIFKMSQDRRHIFVVTRLIALLSAIFGVDSVQSQAQIGIGEYDEFNDPEPDVAVLKGVIGDYLDREPDPATEILLVAEASNTTLRGDATTKAGIYARHGIPEYWIVAIPTRQLIIHRNPAGGIYADINTYNAPDFVAPLFAPNYSVLVADLLP